MKLFREKSGLRRASNCWRRRKSSRFHTYSAYARGVDMINGAYHIMDLAPKGRDEDDLPYNMSWLRRRDQYDD